MAASRRLIGTRLVFWTILILCISTGIVLPLERVTFMVSRPLCRPVIPSMEGMTGRQRGRLTMNVTLSSGRTIPVEMHKIRIVQKTSLVPIKRRLAAIEEAGYNTFLLRTRDVFLDMLTDSGTNAMSDNQLAAMMVSDDAYAGSESFYRLADAVKEVLGFDYTMPVHQGRAAEHLLAKVFIKPGAAVVMNYHFTTTKVHF